jgi:hypothetical protein
MTNEKLDEAGVLAKFGVGPALFVDYLTLIGDSIDNVPGVPKVGPKTAVKLLTEHGSLDALITNADKVAGAIGDNLRSALQWFARRPSAAHGQVRCRIEARPGSAGCGSGRHNKAWRVVRTVSNSNRGNRNWPEAAHRRPTRPGPGAVSQLLPAQDCRKQNPRR